MKLLDIKKGVEAKRFRSHWERQVQDDALAMIDELWNNELEWEDDITASEFEELALSGAKDWWAYSYGGCALIMDVEIAERYCTPSELKRTNCGELPPNKHESWVDVQGRALFQACALVKRVIREGERHV